MLIALPTLIGTRVTLRPLTVDDIDLYFEYLQDPEGLRLTGTHRTFTRSDALEWLVRLPTLEDRVDLAIVPHDVGHFVGEVVINSIDMPNHCASLRVGLGPDAHRGKGYGTEALHLLIAWAFEQLALNRIELEVYAFNARAIHVYEGLGFQHEGVRRQSLYQDGRFVDTHMMGLLRGELKPLR